MPPIIEFGIFLLISMLAILSAVLIILLLNVNKILISMQKLLSSSSKDIQETFELLPSLIREFRDIGFILHKNIDDVDKSITQYKNSFYGTASKINKTAGIMFTSLGLAKSGLKGAFRIFAKNKIYKK